MRNLDTERLVRTSAAAITVIAAIAALLLSDNRDLEVVMLMVGAVAAGLLAFDTAMDRRRKSFAPWVLLSLAPIAKAVPTVWVQVRPEDGLLVERYDRAGSLLFGACVFGAIALLARPSRRFGSSTKRFVVAVIAGTAITGALAGASVAFSFDPNLGSVNAGRLLETPTWFVLSGLLAATVIAASQAKKLSFSLTGTLATGAATAAALAFSVVGRDVGLGWWIALFAGFAVSAVDGKLVGRSTRGRQSSVATIVALIVGLIAAASAISARSDRVAWAPGWALLAIASLAMFALAMASKPADRASRTSQTVDDPEAQARAMATLQMDPRLDAALTPESSVEEFADQLNGRRRRQPVTPGSASSATSRGPAGTGFDDVAAAASAESLEQRSSEAPPPEPAIPEPQFAVDETQPEWAQPVVDESQPEWAQPVVDESQPEWAEPVVDESQPEWAEPVVDESQPEWAEPVVDESQSVESQFAVDESQSVESQFAVDESQSVESQPVVDESQSVESQSVVDESQSVESQSVWAQALAGDEPTTPERLAVVDEQPSDVAPAQPPNETAEAPIPAGASAGNAPLPPRPTRAPVDQAHHFDPSTGLLSASGLQRALDQAFAVPRQAGHVTMLMFMIRDIDRIEQQHGRLASAAVTREVADRVAALLPQGTGARFARSGYAIVFVADLSNVAQTTQWLARVLLKLRAPVEGGSLGDKIDVVAGMAQCYEGEDVVPFIERANQGLVRAAQLPEPTLVVMP